MFNPFFSFCDSRLLDVLPVPTINVERLTINLSLPKPYRALTRNSHLAGALIGYPAEMRDRLLRVTGLVGGVGRHLVAQRMDVAGATGRLALVARRPNPGEHLPDGIGYRGLPESGTLGGPRACPQLPPGVDMHRGRPAATPEQAVIRGRA